MNNKKKYIIVMGIILFVIAGIGIICFMNNKEEEKYITKYEWVEMLAQEIGITESLNSTPYFEDVLEDNEYFSIIQSSVEWGLLEDETEFNGDSYVTGEFMALTIMKTINDEKIQIFLNTKDAITEEEYLSTAVELGIIEEDKLQEYYSTDEAEAVLEKYREAYFNKFWFDDYEVVEYSANVVGITSEEILQGDESATNIVVSSETLNKLSIGKIIVFEYGNNNSKYARKIININPDGSLVLSDDVRIDEVINSLIVSDVEEISFDDIKEDYVTRNTTNQTQTLAYQKSNDAFVNTKVFSGNMESKGFKISLSSTDTKGCLQVEITNNETGDYFTTLIDDTIEVETDFAVEIDIDKMYIGAQFNYSVLEGLKYVDVAIDSHATITGSVIGFDEEKKIPLFKKTIPFGNGLIEANVQILLVLAADGSISFEAEIPVETAIYYEKEKSIRNFDTEVSVEEPQLEANSNASVMLRVEPVLCLLNCIDIIDIETDTGIVASAKTIQYANAQVCTDISVSTPVLTILVSGDDEADTLIGALGISAEWNVIEPENAPFILNFHFEKKKDEKLQIVDECTYTKNGAINQEDTEIKTEEDSDADTQWTDVSAFYDYGLPLAFVINYETYDTSGSYEKTRKSYENNITKYEDYYIIEGTLECLECIDTVTIHNLKEGDKFETINGNVYTIGTREVYNDGNRKRINLIGEDGREYVILGLPSSIIDRYTSKTYYQILCADTRKRIVTKYENVKLRIDNSTQITCEQKSIAGNFMDGTFESYMETRYYSDFLFPYFDLRYDVDGKLTAFDCESEMPIYSNGNSEIRNKIIE